MEIANELVKMQVDSGASCNVLPRKLLARDTEIKKTNLKLTTYSKTNSKVLGVAKISLRNPKNKKKYRAEFAIIDEDYTPLLGSSAAQQMNECMNECVFIYRTYHASCLMAVYNSIE